MIADYACKKCEIHEETIDDNGNEVSTLHPFVFEYFSVNSQDVPVCPQCGARGDDLEKQISTKTSFVLKGSGWYSKGGY